MVANNAKIKLIPSGPNIGFFWENTKNATPAAATAAKERIKPSSRSEREFALVSFSRGSDSAGVVFDGIVELVQSSLGCIVGAVVGYIVSTMPGCVVAVTSPSA